jgi:hypothetical protein
MEGKLKAVEWSQEKIQDICWNEGVKKVRDGNERFLACSFYKSGDSWRDVNCNNFTIL